MIDAYQAVSNLVFTYAERIDAGDFSGLADLFTNAVVTAEGNPTVATGRDAVQEMYEGTTRRYPDDGTPKTKHVTTNLIIDVDDAAGSATCRSYFCVMQAVPGALALQPIVAGRYRDSFRRLANGNWEFATRHMVVDLIGDLSQHLLIDITNMGQ